MTYSLKGHFDGKVIVPDEAVDLPVNEPLQIAMTPLKDTKASTDVVGERLHRLERVIGCMTAPVPSDDSLRRENLYDERS